MRNKHKNRPGRNERAKLVKATAWLIISTIALAIVLFAFAIVAGIAAGG